MARPVVKQEEPLALVASAALPSVRQRARDTKPPSAGAWQNEAWGYYDTIGELRYATNWFSNALSRAELYAAEVMPDGTRKRLTSGPEAEIVDAIFGDNGTEMLKEFGKHYFVPGEWYLVGRKDGFGREKWEVYSSKEVRYINDVWEIKPGGSRAEVIRLTKKDFIDRMWKAHPTSHHEPDSPVRAILPNLREINSLTMHISAQTNSRLYTGELAFFPSEIELPRPVNAPPDLNNAEALMALLQEAMAASVRAPGTPESLVPIILTMPGEFIEKVSKMSFWTELDEKATEMREKAIARMALGLDMPPEVLTGTAGLNHWGSWQVEESSIKAHIEPALDTITALLTESLIVPTRDPDDTRRIVVAYDTSKLRMRPNRSKEAIELWEHGMISSEALLRETGFAGDVPTPEDRKLFILLKMASGSATPEMVALAAQLLGVSQVQPLGVDMREARPDPSLEDHPVREIPELDLGALRVVMMRAMERAGNKLKNRLPRGQFSMIAAGDLYLHVKPASANIPELLEDAWCFLPKIVPSHLVDQVEAGLTRYAHTLFNGQLQITEEGLRSHLVATMAPRTHEGDD